MLVSLLSFVVDCHCCAFAGFCCWVVCSIALSEGPGRCFGSGILVLAGYLQRCGAFDSLVLC